MVRHPGIEPRSLPWQGSILPLDQCRIISKAAWRIEKCESGKQVVSATDKFLLTEMQEEKELWQRRAPHLQLKFESVVCQEQGTSIAHQGHKDAGAAQG